MRVFECQGQRFGFARNDDQMDVIGHETVANQGNRVAAVLGSVYTYFAFLFSFLYHGLAYAWGVEFAWSEAIVTSAFIPFLITDLPKVAVVRFVGGVHCTLIVAVGVGTIVRFFRRKLDAVQKSAEEMRKRLADQSVREKYLLVRERQSLSEEMPPIPPAPQPKVRRGRKGKPPATS